MSVIEEFEYHISEAGTYWTTFCVIVMGVIILYRMILRLRPLIKVNNGTISIYDEGLYPGESKLSDIKYILVSGFKNIEGCDFSIIRIDGTQIELPICNNSRTPEEVISFLNKHDIATKFVQK